MDRWIMIRENLRTLQPKDLFHRQLVTFGRFVSTFFPLIFPILSPYYFVPPLPIHLSCIELLLFHPHLLQLASPFLISILATLSMRTVSVLELYFVSVLAEQFVRFVILFSIHPSLLIHEQHVPEGGSGILCC